MFVVIQTDEVGKLLCGNGCAGPHEQLHQVSLFVGAGFCENMLEMRFHCGDRQAQIISGFLRAEAGGHGKEDAQFRCR